MLSDWNIMLPQNCAVTNDVHITGKCAAIK